jgi:hypothetical protein
MTTTLTPDFIPHKQGESKPCLIPPGVTGTRPGTIAFGILGTSSVIVEESHSGM